MNFDEIVVKESPGICRCCLSEGCYKDLGSEYIWMNEAEVYADMLLDCFDIGITQHSDGPNGAKRLICEVCITRLRDACNFKKQVLDSEKRFIDMLGRGEFRSKMVLFKPPMELKVESIEEPPEDVMAEDVEYLDDMEYEGNEEDVKVEGIQSTSRATTSEDRPLKRGRPKKDSSPTKAKRQKTVKGGTGRKIRKSNLDRLSVLRRNISTVLRFSNAVPFNWNTKGFRCFYCCKDTQDCYQLINHSRKHTSDIDLFVAKHIITKDVPVKIDITDLKCKVCSMSFAKLDDLIPHIIESHEGEYDHSVGVCFFSFVLNKQVMQCVICQNSYDNFATMIRHMYKIHIDHKFMCQMCGISFKDQIRLKRHITNSHDGYKCTACKKTFAVLNKLNIHKQQYHGQVKLHECNLCSEKFLNTYQVKVHMGKVHNVEKYKIKCEHCPKVCTTKGAMLIHMQGRHSKIRYQCNLCDYSAGIKWLIKLHKRKHFGVKEYTCSICERQFGRSSNLRVHMKVHTGKVGRVCRVCRKGFTDLQAFEKHKLDVQDHF